jgi:hypothetical protein
MRYENPSHETIGSDILAVLRTMRYPGEVLGAGWLERLRALDPGGWYPVSTLLELLEYLAHKGGRASLVQMGRQLFRDSHLERVSTQLQSAGDVLFGMDTMYRHANRGQNLGGWEVLRFGAGHAVLSKTTPHHCALEEGILYEALHSVGAESLIVQEVCMQHGATHCELEIRSPVRDHRWTGRHSLKSPLRRVTQRFV